ncbi:MAG: hypothetical protein JEY79_13905 [Pseudodesulfovibrio sp.]|nr:hypothetical protein [Pseudodesulfovibrio sp.]
MRNRKKESLDSRQALTLPFDDEQQPSAMAGVSFVECTDRDVASRSGNDLPFGIPGIGKLGQHVKARSEIAWPNRHSRGNSDMPLPSGSMLLPERDDISDDEALQRAGITVHDLCSPYMDGCFLPSVVPRITPENLPVILSKAINEKPKVGELDLKGWEPKWTLVMHTPGYFQAGIRQLGRRIFSLYTDIPVEEIQLMSTLIQPDEDVKRMLKWIVVNSVRDLKAEIDFETSILGFAADMQIWSTEGYQFMAVKDYAGYYIYAWPGGRGVQLGSERSESVLGSEKTQCTEY